MCGFIGQAATNSAGTVAQPAAKPSSLFALASVLANKSKEDVPSIKTSMLPFLPQRPILAAQSLNGHAQQQPQRRTVAAARSARQEPAADPLQQAADALPKQPVYAAATVPCYEPGFLTRPFRQV